MSGRAFCPCIGLYTCLCFREFHSPHESLPFQLRLNQHLFSADLVRRFWPMMLVASVTSHSSSISCQQSRTDLWIVHQVASNLNLRCTWQLLHKTFNPSGAMPGCAMGIEVFESSGRSCNDKKLSSRSFCGNGVGIRSGSSFTEMLLQRRHFCRIFLLQEIIIRYYAAFVHCSASGRMMRK